MHKTEGQNHIINMFQNGPPGTRVEEDWLNSVQEELIYLLTKVGLSPLTAATDTRQQIYSAIRKQFPYYDVVRDYDADPTGVVDAAVIQDAIDAAGAVGGGVVVIPVGNFRITSSLTPANNVILRGMGWNSIIQNDGAGNAISWIGTDGNRLNGFGIENLRIKGNGSSADGVHLEYTKRYADGKIWIRNCMIDSHGNDGIYWTKGDNLSIAESLITNNDRYGIYFFSQSNAGIISRCSVSHNASRGCYINTVVSDTVIENCSVSDNGDYGIYFYRVEGGMIRSNVLNRNVSGMFVGGVSTRPSFGISVMGNLFGDNGSSDTLYHLVIGYTKDVLVLNNTFLRVDEAAAIRLATGDVQNGLTIFNNYYNRAYSIFTDWPEGRISDGNGNNAYVSMDNIGNILHVSNIGETRLHWAWNFIEAAAALASTNLSKLFWTGGGTNGTQAVVEATGGRCNLITNTGNDDSSSILYPHDTFTTSKNPKIKARILLDVKTTAYVFVGMVDAAFADKGTMPSDYVGIEFDTDVDADNLYMVSNDAGGGEVKLDTEEDLSAGTYYKILIDLSDTENPRFYINDKEVTGAFSGTIQDTTTMYPFFLVQSLAGSAQRVLTVTNVDVWQDR